MYDYWLGGAHNFAVDRAQADRIEASNHTARHAARSNRDFLRRVVQRCLADGIDQFLDLGSGVPTVGNVHEVAPLGPGGLRRPRGRRGHPLPPRSSRRSTGRRSPGRPRRRRRPCSAPPGWRGCSTSPARSRCSRSRSLHYVPGDLAALLAPYRERLVPGSALAISHVTDEQPDPDLVRAHPGRRRGVPAQRQPGHPALARRADRGARRPARGARPGRRHRLAGRPRPRWRRRGWRVRWRACE